MSEGPISSSKDGRESYKHAAAKEVVAEWIRSARKADGYWSCGGLSACPNRGEPWHGVFTEYPLCPSTFQNVWDEHWDPAIEAIDDCWHHDSEFKTWPDYQWMINNGYQNFYIADIALQHKGMISQVIEIVHTNFLSIEKAAFYRINDCSCVILSADWVLNQIRAPEQFSGIIIDSLGCRQIGGGLRLDRFSKYLSVGD